MNNKPLGGTGPLQTWWTRVPEPREISVLFSLVYLLAAFMGFSIFLSPGVWRMEGSDLTAHVMIASFLVIGSLISSIAGFYEHWKYERAGLIFLISAMVTYGYLVLLDHAARQVTDILHPGTVALALSTFVIRRFMIRIFTKRPGVTDAFHKR